MDIPEVLVELGLCLVEKETQDSRLVHLPEVVVEALGQLRLLLEGPAQRRVYAVLQT